MTEPTEQTGNASPVTIDGRDLLVALLFTLCVVAVFVGVSLFFSKIAPANRSNNAVFSLLSGFFAYAGIFAAAWFAAVRRPGKRLRDIGLRRCEPSFLIIGIFAALLWIGVSAALYSAAGQWDRSIADGRSLIKPFLANPYLIVLLLILAGPVAAFVEEVAFRGLLYGWLRGRTGVTAAALISGILFTAVHFYVYVAGFFFFIEMLALAVLLALLFEASRSLWPGILCHAVNNLAVLSLYLLKT